MSLDQYDTIRPVVWENESLKLLDQRILPQEYEYISYDNSKALKSEPNICLAAH